MLLAGIAIVSGTILTEKQRDTIVYLSGAFRYVRKSPDSRRVLRPGFFLSRAAIGGQFRFRPSVEFAALGKIGKDDPA